MSLRTNYYGYEKSVPYRFVIRLNLDSAFTWEKAF